MIAVTMKWRVTFRKESLSNQAFYGIEYDTNSLTLSDILNVMKALKAQKYKDIDYRLIVTFPP